MTDSSGELAAALANAIVALTAEYTGRGSPRSRCYVHEDLIVCVLHDSLTKGEVSLVQDGKEEAVLAIPTSQSSHSCSNSASCLLGSPALTIWMDGGRMVRGTCCLHLDRGNADDGNQGRCREEREDHD